MEAMEKPQWTGCLDGVDGWVRMDLILEWTWVGAGWNGFGTPPQKKGDPEAAQSVPEQPEIMP